MAKTGKKVQVQFIAKVKKTEDKKKKWLVIYFLWPPQCREIPNGVVPRLLVALHVWVAK